MGFTFDHFKLSPKSPIFGVHSKLPIASKATVAKGDLFFLANKK